MKFFKRGAADGGGGREACSRLCLSHQALCRGGFRFRSWTERYKTDDDNAENHQALGEEPAHGVAHAVAACT